MVTFSYTAVDSDGKEVKGSLEAADLTSATSSLQSLHMDVVRIDESSRIKRDQQYSEKEKSSSAQAGLSLFYFEAKDTSGMVHQGSLQAEDRGVAFRRLRDQGFEVISLLSSDDTPVSSEPLPLSTPPSLSVAAASPAPSLQADPAPLTNHTESSSPPTAPSLSRAASLLTPVNTLDSLSSAAQTLPAQLTPSSPLSAPAPVDTGIKASPPIASESHKRIYASLFVTMRLYAGWLLAWYGLFMAFGYYLTIRNLPFTILGAQGFYASGIIFTFILAIFLYLMLHTIFEILRGGILLGVTFFIVGLISFLFLRAQLVP